MLDHRWCARVHQTAQNFHGVAGEAMARATQEMWMMWHALDCRSYARTQGAQSWLYTLACRCARSSLLGSRIVHSITPSVLDRTSRGLMCTFGYFHPFHRRLMLMTCSTTKR
jgi:hypothetical protein